MNAEWRLAAQRAFTEAGINARVKHQRVNSFYAKVEIKQTFAKSIERALLSNLNDQGWHLSIAVLPEQSEIRFIFYGKIPETPSF